MDVLLPMTHHIRVVAETQRGAAGPAEVMGAHHVVPAVPGRCPVLLPQQHSPVEGGGTGPVTVRPGLSPRKRASVTAVASLRMCLMSMVNSEIKASYRLTWRVKLSPVTPIACVSGL